MKTLAVDCRMSRMSGIGVYLRTILPLCMASLPDTRFRLLEYDGSIDIPSNCIWEAVRFTAPVYSLREQYKILSCLKGCTALWVPHYPIPVFAPIPVVATVHDVAHLALHDLYRGLTRAYAASMFQMVRHKAVELLFVSQFTRREFIRYVGKPKGHMTVVHNGVDAVWRQFPLQERKNPPYFLAVGNIKPHKNVRLLCKAFARIADMCNTKLLFVGERTGFRVGESSLESLMNLCPGRIDFTGFISREELIAMMSGAVALVFPSRYEGFGLPLLEALSAGIPVIASDIPVTREICDTLPSYFSPESEEQLAHLMLETLSLSASERRLKGEQGRAWASRYTWERAAESTVAVLRRALVMENLVEYDSAQSK